MKKILSATLLATLLFGNAAVMAEEAKTEEQVKATTIVEEEAEKEIQEDSKDQNKVETVKEKEEQDSKEGENNVEESTTDGAEESNENDGIIKLDEEDTDVVEIEIPEEKKGSVSYVSIGLFLGITILLFVGYFKKN